uniref:SAYSvFN domain-containing protein n=1 Tax=Elaeophora elaphi TaxID=1147741 RepID=A0A158Q806_9BILA
MEDFHAVTAFPSTMLELLVSGRAGSANVECCLQRLSASIGRMKCVEGRLAEYRRKEGAAYNNSKGLKLNLIEIEVSIYKGRKSNKIPNHDKIYEEQSGINGSITIQPTIISKLINILQKPVQLWLCLWYQWPRSCIVFAVLSWFIALWYFTYIEFGLVFFVSSLFVLLFINLGRRKSGELSAYSVFNPQCERLPGTLTAEHFERDLLKRKRYLERERYTSVASFFASTHKQKAENLIKCIAAVQY